MPVPPQKINGHWVYGGAAQNVFIKRQGGFDAFVAKIAKKSADHAVASVLDELEKEFVQTRLKRIK